MDRPTVILGEFRGEKAYHRGGRVPTGFEFEGGDQYDPDRRGNGRSRSFGIVASIARPGGNITGVSVEAGLDVWGKRLQVLREAVPTASKAGFLGSHQIWNLPQVNALRETTQQLHISLLGPPMESPIDEKEYRRVLEAMAQEHVDGLIIGDQLEHVTYRRLIVDLAFNGRVPAV